MDSRLMFALFTVGLLLRCALYFPPAMFQLDSDAVIAGLCGFRVMSGQHPVFLPGGIRIGAASCYAAASYFQLFGVGRLGLALTGLTWGGLYLLFSLFFIQANLGRRLAALAYVFAIAPSEQFMTVTYAPWGYGEIMAACAATLWLASVWRTRASVLARCFIGLSIGLGIWFSLQTLMITIPALVWVALKRQRAVISESLVAVPGAFLGALPFLSANVATGFPSLTQNSYSQAVSNPLQALANFTWLLTNLGPKLLFRFPASPDWIVLLAAFAFAAIGFFAALRRGVPNLASRQEIFDASQLFALVLVCCVLIFSFSQAGVIRGWTVRYIAPLYVVVPLFYAIGIAGLWRSKALAVSVTVALLIPNLISYGLPGSAARTELTTELADDGRLREVLAQRNVRLVYGDYLWVYHLNFDTQERIAGVASVEAYDYYKYGQRLDRLPVRWAVLGGLDEVVRWTHSLGPGTLIKSGDLWVFIAKRRAPNAAALIAALRKIGT